MLLHTPELVRLYAGISTLDRRTLQALVGSSGLYYLMGHTADMLMLYGTSFAVEGKRASVPGGPAAIPVWAQMAGASPEQAGVFYQALLQRKSPTLLAYFYALSHLDLQHQKFFTANAERANRFYTLFSTMPESKATTGAAVHDSSFAELLSSVPLDESGHVRFPGSPEVWTIAKGNGADEKRVGKMLKKVSRAATPDVEDEVLLHLLDTRYTTHSVSATELDNFLAVSKIDVHRTKPLDEEAALLLAQSFAEFQGYYPYFTELTAVDTPGFRSFFTMAGQIQHLPVLQQQMALGEFNALTEWVVLLKRGMVIDDAEAARLFKLICDREGAASGEGVRATVSIDLAQTILGHCGTTEATWDDTLRNCLLGRSANGVDERGKDYQIVLDEQKAPSLDVMRSIVSSARGAASPGASRPVMIKPRRLCPG